MTQVKLPNGNFKLVSKSRALYQIDKTLDQVDKTLEDIDKEEQKNIESNYEFNIGDYAKIKGLNDTGIIISINMVI